MRRNAKTDSRFRESLIKNFSAESDPVRLDFARGTLSAPRRWVAAGGKYAPPASYVLTGKFEAEPTIGAGDQDCCCHRLNALPPHGFAEPRRFARSPAP